MSQFATLRFAEGFAMIQLKRELRNTSFFAIRRSMRVLVAAFLCLFASASYAEPPVLPLPWIQLTEIYYTPSQARMYGSGGSTINCGAPAGDGSRCNAVYVQTHLPSGQNEGPQTPSTPITVDLTPYGVAADAKAAFLSGILIITHGTSGETADLHITFAAEGSPIDCVRYLGQSIEAATGGGQRQPFSTWVPLTNGKFKFCYYVGTGGSYPSNSAYGINLSLQAWGR